MASTNKTKNYKLNQWLGSDYMKRDDLNSDNELIDAALKYNADSLSAEAAARAAGDSEIRELVSSEAASRQAADEEINSIIKSGVTMSPSIELGMNSVIRKTDGITSFPKFTMQGKSYVNLLGKDGNCEDVGKWGLFQATSALDGMNKVFGANSIKITISSTFTQGLIHKVGIFDAAKYYFVSAYFKNGNATSAFIQKDVTGGGTYFKSSEIADTTKFVRVGMVLSPSQLNSGNYLHFVASGTAGQYVYVDGIMLQEITASEYTNLSVAQLLEKYPYVDSYACLQNPYIEVRHDNLVRNGIGEEEIAWWVSTSAPDASISVDSGRIKLVGSIYNGVGQRVNVKPNTNYYVRGNVSGVTYLAVYSARTGGSLIRNGSGTFSSGSLSEVWVYLLNNATGIGYFDSIMLIEGTSPPASYKPCRIERCVAEGKFTSDDTIVYENGEVSGLLNWKHRTLYGKDYDWQYSADQVGYKQIALTFTQGQEKWSGKVIKYDGKIIPLNGSVTPDTHNLESTYISLGLYDTDTGWIETVNPNADEVKAFMNGWKAVANDGTRYVLWQSIVDSSYPASILTTTTTAAVTAGSSKVLPVVNGAIFSVNDRIVVPGYVNSLVTAVSGNNVTVASVAANISSGITIAKADTPTTNTSLLSYCKNNIAPGYEGYQLHYKLANPEPITDANVHVHGDIPKLDNGDNYLYVDSGMVLGEVSNIISNGTYLVMNNSVEIAYRGSEFNNKTEVINAIYKNLLYNTDKWTFAGTYAYGNQYAYMTVASGNFDTNATYTVDYQILKTLHTTPTAITMQYQQDVLSAVADLADGLNNRQKSDSALDTLVDLSVYEQFSIAIRARGVKFGTVSHRVSWFVKIADKRVVPVLTVSNLSCLYYDGAGSAPSISNSEILVTFGISKGYLGVNFSYIGSNASIQNAILNYGMVVDATITLDCRGRI